LALSIIRNNLIIFFKQELGVIDIYLVIARGMRKYNFSDNHFSAVSIVKFGAIGKSI
jgi:hypothetical protein